MIYRFMEDQSRFHSVEMMAEVLEVSRSGYYSWRRRIASRRQKKNVEVAARIRTIQKNARWSYGSRRVTEELNKQGIRIGKNRIAHIMRAQGLNRRPPKKYRVTTDSSHRHAPAPNLLNRNFTVQQPNRVWVSDITYCATAEGWMYLCVILDLYSRRVVGWSMSESLATDVVLQALWMALMRRGRTAGLIFHSDRGVQYASDRFRRELRDAAMRQSMSRKGNCWDNACAESFFGSLKTELIADSIYPTRREAKNAIFEYIEVFYNRQRLHSTIGYATPVEYEEQQRQKTA